MQKELVVDARDRLTKMIEEYLEDAGVVRDLSDEQDVRVISCCLAIAVEELEKYLYDDDWTPSVIPYREGEEWHWPGENDNSMSGPPFARKMKSVEEKFPVLEKLRKKGPIPKVERIPLVGHLPMDWTPLESEMFRDGDFQEFCRAVRITTQAPLKDVSAYASRMKKEYPDIWGVNMK
jgi:hypothetical protein